MKEYNTSVATAIVRLTLEMIPIEVSEVAWQPETLVKGFPTSLIQIGFRRARKLVYIYIHVTIYNYWELFPDNVRYSFDSRYRHFR